MILTHHDLGDPHSPDTLTDGLPSDAALDRLPLDAARTLELAALACDAADADDAAAHDAEMADLVARTTAWARGRVSETWGRRRPSSHQPIRVRKDRAMVSGALSA